jgi:long-chain acyl-CoA synthetase
MATEDRSQAKPWLTFYDEGVPSSLEYPPIPLDRLLVDSTAKHPTHTALIFGARIGGRVGNLILDRALSYQQLDDAVNRFAAGLQELGVSKGDRVAIITPNCPQFVIAFYGILRAGGIAVPCNFLYTAEEIEHQLNDAGAEIVVVLSPFYKKVHGIRARTRLRHLIVTNIKEYFPPLLRLLFTLTKEKREGHRVEVSSASDDFWFQSLLGAPATTPKPVPVGPEDTACLLYTGGTTGVPKGAELTHRNLLSNAVAVNAWAGTREAQDVVIGSLPLFHSYGLTTVMNGLFVRATTAVLIPDPRDVLHVMGAISRHRATLFPGVPTMYIAINNHPQVKEFDLSSIRACVSGAAPLPRDVQETFQTITGGLLVEGYGLTEASPITHANPVYAQNKIGTIGLPWPVTDAKIVDAETGERELPVGDIGELIVRGPQVMKGYWRQPTETANVLRVHPWTGTDEPWLHTGDIALMDEEGYFQIIDRKKDMIICGGFNVYPRDVEEALFKHPAVQEAAVVGTPDEYRGETVRAFVVLMEGTAATEEEIIAFCRDRLARYKVPTAVEFRAELPKSTVGKVLRRELAAKLPP